MWGMAVTEGTVSESAGTAGKAKVARSKSLDRRGHSYF